MTTKKKLNVLVVDDNEHEQAVANYLLSDYNLVVRSDYMGARNELFKRNFDVLLTDLNFPYFKHTEGFFHESNEDASLGFVNIFF